jgi:hypothetical protein
MDAAIATVAQIKRQNPRTSWRDERYKEKRWGGGEGVTSFTKNR